MVQRIPLTAKAQCADGAGGDLSGLVVRADSRTLEYFVVLDNTEGHRIERLVPRTQGHLDPSGVIALDCQYAQLIKMQPLNVQEYGPTGPPKGGRSAAYGLVDAERAPDGTGVLRANQTVEASNGKIGMLNGVVIDDTGQITHFYTGMGKKGESELFLPVSAVYYVDRFSIYLRLDKKQVESLPTTPTGEPAHKHMELVARVYDTPKGAAEDLERLRHAGQPVHIRDVAVLAREGEGAPHIVDGARTGTKKGAVTGLAVGGLVAMLGPVGLAGALAAGAVGGLAGSRIELGFPKEFLSSLQARLQPDHSALVLLIEVDPGQDAQQMQSILDGGMSGETLVETLVQEMLAAEAPAVHA